MTGSRLKSELKNPYQKTCYPFWRRPENDQKPTQELHEP